MTDARPLSNPTGAPDEVVFAAGIQSARMVQGKRVGGRPKRIVPGILRRPYDLRSPEPGETGLSASEIRHGIAIRVLAVDDETDLWPMVRLHVGPGQWRIKGAGAKRAGPFDGLTA
jgi:hypothetical protein